MDTNTHIDLNRAVISVSGPDSKDFLQNMITNDINKVGENNAIYSYLLTPQGKYLFDFFISKKNDEYLIEISVTDKEEFLKKLKMYKLRSNVEIKDSSGSYIVATADSSSGYADPRSAKMPNRCIRDRLNAMVSPLIENYHNLRIENNIPEGDDLEKNKSFPLQYRMNELHGVDYRKGCYVGQEVTARTHHQGVIRKTTYTVESTSPLSRETEVKSGDITVGKILSSSGSKAIAMLEKEAVEAGKPLTALGFPIKIV